MAINSRVRSRFSNSASSSEHLAIVVAGYGGKISQFSHVISDLMDIGYDVLTFEYDKKIIKGANAKQLPALIDEITRQVKKQSPNYTEILCSGVSLGAIIALNIQRRLPKAHLGIYAALGVPLSSIIFNTSLSKRTRKKYLKQNIDEVKLLGRWKNVEPTAKLNLGQSKTILVALGKQDDLIPYKSAVKMMAAWERQPVDINYFGLIGKGHGSTVKWYRKNMGKLLKKMHKIQTAD